MDRLLVQVRRCQEHIHAAPPQAAHQPRHRAARDLQPLAAQLPPHLADAIAPEVLRPDPLDLRAKTGVAPRPGARSGPGRSVVACEGFYCQSPYVQLRLYTAPSYTPVPEIWSDWLTPDAAFPVRGKSVRSQLHSVPDCQAIVKKAIVEHLRQFTRTEWFPETGPEFAVEVSLLKDRATLTLDTTGPGLHKRGYRTLVGAVSAREPNTGSRMWHAMSPKVPLPKSIRDVVEALVYPSVNLAEETDTAEDSYIRFIALLGMSHRDLFMEALENRWNSGYLRCLDHLRRLMPEMPEAAKNQRFVFLGAYLSGVIAAREAALAEWLEVMSR